MKSVNKSAGKIVQLVKKFSGFIRSCLLIALPPAKGQDKKHEERELRASNKENTAKNAGVFSLVVICGHICSQTLLQRKSSWSCLMKSTNFPKATRKTRRRILVR